MGEQCPYPYPNCDQDRDRFQPGELDEHVREHHGEEDDNEEDDDTGEDPRLPELRSAGTGNDRLWDR